MFVKILQVYCRRSQWPHGLRRRSAAARLQKLWVRIPPGAWMFVCCGCCVLSGRGLCDELIICVEESYRLWCVVVCDLETSWMRRPWPALCRYSLIRMEPFLSFSSFSFLWHFDLYSNMAITLTNTTLGGTPLDEWSARCTALTTYNTPKRQIYTTTGGNRTRNLCKREAAKSRPRPRGHRNRL